MKAYLFTLPLILSLAACATAQGGASPQQISVNTAPIGAICTLTNDAGKTTVTTPSFASVNRSGSDLQVYCAKGKLHGSQTIKSGASKAMDGNAAAGGLIGALVDMNSGAAYEYPVSINVTLK